MTMQQTCQKGFKQRTAELVIAIKKVYSLQGTYPKTNSKHF
ncbi:hypothetical protein SynBIOSE41_03684 [Synechococcus sp. BIOS-E4-1]|nr:hypothetical protein SynBIOSE41_03684 [Synechococcus sp. BIOS-E4-1]